MTTITRDEWLAEFERVMRPSRAGDPGLSSEELAEALGVSRAAIGAMLRAALRQGRLKAGTKPGFRTDGKRTHTPCYTLLPLPKAAKRR